MQRAQVWFGAIFAIALLIAASWAVYQSVLLFVTVNTTAKLGVVTATLSVVALIYNNSRQQAREIRSRHFSEKRQAYQKFFDFLFEHFEDQREGRTTDENIIMQKANAIIKDLMIWGSPETINQYNVFLRNSNIISDDPKFPIANVEAFLRSLRKDLGHDDRKLEKFGLSKLLIKSEEHGNLT